MKWYLLDYQPFGHDGCKPVMTEIESPEKIGGFDLAERSLDQVIEAPIEPEFVSRNGDGMARRAYVIASEEARAANWIRAQFQKAQWFLAKVRGSYWENGREYGHVREVYLAQVK